MEKKIPMSAAPMSRQTMGAHLGLYLKYERKTKLRQLRVKKRRTFPDTWVQNLLWNEIKKNLFQLSFWNTVWIKMKL